MANLNTHRATAPMTPKRQTNPFLTPNTSATSAKQGASAKGKNELSPNTEMKQLTSVLSSTSLNSSMNTSQDPQSKHRQQRDSHTN